MVKIAEDNCRFTFWAHTLIVVSGWSVRIMADETLEHHDPGGPGQPPQDNGTDESRRAAGRRRVIMTGLLTPPAVMTLNARRAAAASLHPSMAQNYGQNTNGQATG